MKISPSKILRFLVINVAESPNIHVAVTAAILRFNHNPTASSVAWYQGAKTQSYHHLT